MTLLDIPLKFEREAGFHSTLRQRVDEYFDAHQLSRRDLPRMYAKTAVIFGWFLASYGLLMFWSTSWLSIVPLTISLGLALAAIGFNVQHDGGHHAYSDSPTINRWMALSLDMMGGSSYVWAKKHNSIHHTFANITGHDDDIDIGALGRLSPHQPRLALHRFQHYYLWMLYGLLPVKWQFYDDFRDCVNGRIGNSPHRLPRPRGWDLATLLLGKAVFYVLALVIPMLLHPVWAVLLVYLGVSFVQGLTMSIVFQLAHCVEEADFPMPVDGSTRMESAWAAHQVETTVDFARGNRLVSWFTGGLNFQIEHHLFPQVCHLHYPAIAPMVEATCDEFGVNYQAHSTFRGALVSHFRWLRRMGETPSPA